VHDDLPAEVITRAEGLFAWRDIESELAELATQDERDLVPVRSHRDPITMSFECEEWTIDCEWLDGQLVGQVVPRVAGAVRPATPTDVLADVMVDAGGVFRVANVPRGPLSLRLVDLDGAEMARTTWVTL